MQLQAPALGGKAKGGPKPDFEDARHCCACAGASFLTLLDAISSLCMSSRMMDCDSSCNDGQLGGSPYSFAVMLATLPLHARRDLSISTLFLPRDTMVGICLAAQTTVGNAKGTLQDGIDLHSLRGVLL